MVTLITTKLDKPSEEILNFHFFCRGRAIFNFQNWPFLSLKNRDFSNFRFSSFLTSKWFFRVKKVILKPFRAKKRVTSYFFPKSYYLEHTCFPPVFNQHFFTCS